MDPSPSSSSSLPLPQAHTLLTNFTTFLTTTLHTLLYHRGLYPRTTFLTTRSPHNLPVHQSRHPAVCAWIASAVSAVKDQLLRGSANRVVFVIHAPPAASMKTAPPAPPAPPPTKTGIETPGVSIKPKQKSAAGAGAAAGAGGGVVERWVFDVSHFPPFGTLEDGSKAPAKGNPNERDRPSERPERDEDRDEDDDAGPLPGDGVNWVDVQEQFRGALRRISYAGEKLAPLPEGCTFTVAVELRDDAPAPVEHPQAWIPAEPNLQPKKEADVGGKTTPIRSVEAGPLFFECWMEEGSSEVQQMIELAREKEGPKGQGMPLA